MISALEMFFVKFEKYQTIGDNYILVDNRDGKYDDFFEDTRKKRRMCEQTYGVGSNAIMELKGHTDYIFEMVNHTKLGNVSQMCGNSSRMCVVHAFTGGLVGKEQKRLSSMLEIMESILVAMMHTKSGLTFQ